jgi:hypothetical protein
MVRLRVCLTIFAVLACAAGAARAELSLGVEVGWEDHYRIGRWTPLLVTIADTSPRAVIVTVSSPHGGGLGMGVSVALSATPAPATYPIYVPLGHMLDELHVTVRDPRTLRLLGEWPNPDLRDAALRGGVVAADVLVVTSGRGPTMRSLGAGGNVRAGNVSVVHVEPLRLPAAAAGYDGLSALVLNQPDLNRLSTDQHQAIADWVRAGGDLVLWPGQDPLPPTSPLVAALPVTVGNTTIFDVDAALLERFGLAPRFAKLPGRRLEPRPGAERVATFVDGGPDAYRARFGFGHVLVMPFDPTFFVFRDDAASRDFWQPLMQGIVDLRPVEDKDRYYYWNDPMLRRAGGAFNLAAELLGNVPGVGRFGFAYVVVILIALMVVVGPVDWFLLKYLGRQPWTWATTAGWIGLVTLGALFIGHIFRSGDLHFRTLRVIDQADGQTVAAHDLVCMYAPRTAMYEFTVPRDGWWQPGGNVSHWRGGPSGLRRDVPFAQDASSTRPLPMPVNVWNLRFLQGQTLEPAPPVIEASLSRAPAKPGGAAQLDRVVGTIVNRGKHPIRDVIVRAQGGGVAWVKGPVAPGEAMQIDQPLTEAGEMFGGTTDEQPADNPSAYRPPFETTTPTYWLLADLAPERSRRVDQLIESRGDLACVYAEVVAPQPAVTINGGGAVEQHWQVVRALVPLSKGEK